MIQVTKYPHKISDESGYTVPLSVLRSNCLADSSAKLQFRSNFCLKASLAKFNNAFSDIPIPVYHVQLKNSLIPARTFA